MRVVAIMAQKGGAGKSTLALHLAVLAQQEGERVLLIDTDPQRSAGDWWRARDADTPEMVEASASTLPETLKAAKADGINLVIVDTAPHAQKEAADAANAADIVLVPCRPGILDLRAIGSTVDILRSAKTPGAIVLNQCPPGRGGKESAVVTEAREALEAYGLPVFPGAIGLRASLSHALISGEAVTEFEPKGRAAKELRALWQWTTKGGFRDALNSKRGR